MTTASHDDVRVGPYRLLSPLGEGGMGVVHLAVAPDGRRVALKVLRPHVVGDAEARERLAREVSTLRRVTSPRVAEILDADPDGPVPYVVTRYVPGLSLYHHVAQEGVLAGRDLLHAMSCLADALAAVHAVGVLHRDIKPTNVLMEGRAPVLIDFGLAKASEDSRLTQTGWLMGTPGYLAPEVLYGEEATTASDVHAWAATVAFGALGHSPYGSGPAMAVMDRVRRGEHDLAAIAAPARELLAAGLATEPHDRPTLREISGWVTAQQVEVKAPRNGDAAELWTRPFVPPPDPDATRHQRLDVTPAAPTEEPVDAPTAAQPVVQPVGREATPYQSPPPAFRSDAPATTVLPADGRVPVSRPAAETPWLSQAPAPPSRAQRWLQLLGLATLAGAAVAYAPYLGTALVALVVLVLRTVSLGRQRHARRLRLRGRARWYDLPASALASPAYALGALFGTFAAVAMAALVGLAMFSVGYLAGQPTSTGLLLAGAGFVPMLWWGPGSSRLRESTSALVNRTARSEWGGWLLAVMAFVGAAALLGVLLSEGPNWAPDVSPPFR